LRNHDELTLEMVTEQERHWMWEQYAPEPHMRLNLGIRRRLASLLDNDRRKIELAHSLLFTLPGSPILYYGDEIGMGDNIWLPDRNGVRTPMQWDNAPGAGFSAAPPERFYAPVIQGGAFGYQSLNVRAQESDPDSLLNWVRRALRVRKAHPALGWGDFAWASLAAEENVSVAAYWRSQASIPLDAEQSSQRVQHVGSHRRPPPSGGPAWQLEDLTPAQAFSLGTCSRTSTSG
jgi:maltose alpha-D-glucosyltransferase/alpha-amylase